MFLKSLTISSGEKIIRKISFRKGINLIVDETSENNKQETGNNVGKTTVLKLIDFCFGANPKNIYIDPESKQEYTLVKDFLINNKVLITLVLIESLDNKNAKEIVIEKNFLTRTKKIQKINEVNLTNDDEFEVKLLNLIFPSHSAEKPTFRQIISHNIRYKDENINQTLRTLDRYTSDVEYETLHLFLFGCHFDKGDERQKILTKLKQEHIFKGRLEKKETKTAYMAALSIINNEIELLEKQKFKLNLNENFEADLDRLNNLRYKINKMTSEINKLNIRRNLIIEAQEDLNSNKTSIDLQQLEYIYRQATNYISNIQKTFNDLVEYHNQMIAEKVKFITKELPALEINIRNKRESLNKLLEEENSLSKIITRTDSFEDLEKLIVELSEKYRKKGEYENIIQQLTEVEDNIEEYNKQLQKIDDNLFSYDFKEIVQIQVDKFNKFFASTSSRLYDEQYALKYDIKPKKNQLLYKFNTFNTNIGSGKKQGEIVCFDIAYILFAEEENMDCVNFLLNDKKELMHDNQLVKIADLVNETNIQFVSSILKDKLPEELNKEDYFIIKLSPYDKLFQIEKYQ